MRAKCPNGSSISIAIYFMILINLKERLVGYLSVSFLGWNLTILIVFLIIYGFSGLANRFKFFELLLTVFFVSIFILMFIPLSLILYMLMKSVREKHGSYVRYFIDTFKGLLAALNKE